MKELAHGHLPAESPVLWWRRLVDAVIDFRVGNKDGVVAYLRWVESSRNRQVAEISKRSILGLAREKSWADVASWPAWEYQCKPPAKPEEVKKPKARRSRR